MKIGELEHAWRNNHMTERRRAFLWTYEMVMFIKPEHLSNAKTGLNPKYRKQRLTQAETQPHVRQNPAILQWVIVDRNDDCIRYNPHICIEDAPPLAEMMKTAVTIEDALEADGAETAAQ
jgi:ribosomal protein L39E